MSKEGVSGNGRARTNARELLAPVWAHLSERIICRAEGVVVWDQNGEALLDFTSGIGVTSTGHCHPRIVEAIREQAQKLLFGQINCVIPETALALAAELDRITPARLNRFLFANSGAEAVEGAVKLAKRVTGRPGVIAFQGSFHGRTHMAMALTASKPIYRQGYEPLPAGVAFVPYPYGYCYGMTATQVSNWCLRELETLLSQRMPPEDTALILIEPVLGEGGYVPAPSEFLRRLRDLCDRYSILLGYDEVQCGFGRTGEWWGHSRSGAEPDLLVMAKGMGSGMPISALAAPADLMEAWPTGSHGGTYGGGNAVVAAAAIATIKTIEEEGLLENALLMGEYLLNGLESIQSHHAVIGDVRGRGLMIGVELSQGGAPAGELAATVARTCREHGLLLLTCGRQGSVIRWIPPLIVDRDSIDRALDIFTEALRSALA